MTGIAQAEDQSEVAAFLGDPASHGGRPVERIDTHGAMVFLAGDRVYKLKRAVRFPYMDFSTPEKRRAACAAELRLNRRTAPDLYLRTAPVVRRADGRLAFGEERAGEGRVLDWVVVMRRFDQDTLFDRLAARGALTPALMERLAEAVAAFHAGAEPHRDQGGAGAMRWVVEDNLAELAGSPELFAPERVAVLAERSRAALARLAHHLDRRRDGGRVRFCHGDLHLGNICLVGGSLVGGSLVGGSLAEGRPTLFDCIEFNDRLAVVDVLYDLAFLLMDLEHRRLRPLGNRVFNRYLEATGDLDGLAPLPLFLSARAAVRAKVDACAAAAQPDPARATALRAEAAAYLEEAIGFLEPPPPALVAVGGLSGTGKTTLARALAPTLGPAPGAVVVRSDALRKHLFGLPETERLPPEAYAAEVTARVYGEMARRARAALAGGQAVVADAVHARPEERAAIEEVAASVGVPFTGLWLEADVATLVARVERRVGDASDATEAVVRRQLGFDLGGIAWRRIEASSDPAVVAVAARAGLDP